MRALGKRMNIRTYSVTQLNRMNREIWCWGCGKRFHELLKMYQEEPFLKRVTELIDSDSALGNVKRTIGERELVIKSFSQVKTKLKRKVLLMITSDHWENICQQLEKEMTEGYLTCCHYPKIYYQYTLFIQRMMKLVIPGRQLLFYAGIQPHENAVSLAIYLKNQYPGRPYRVYFLGDGKEEAGVSGFIKYLNQNTMRTKGSFKENMRYCWQYARSRYLLYENESVMKMSRYQRLIYLNHGTIPLKNVRDVLRQPKALDYAICPSVACAKIYEDQYGISSDKFLYCMPPRVELIKEKRNLWKRILGGKERQLILWLPTFRSLKDTERKDSQYNHSLSLLQGDSFERIKEQLHKNDQVLWIKLHPREKDGFPDIHADQRIRFLTDDELEKEHIILQELLADTAALITDYSGIGFEYLLTGNPIGYVVMDLEEYHRGFAFENPYDYMPGEKIRTTEQLLDFLDIVASLDVSLDRYRDEREKLKARLFQGNDEMNASAEFIKLLDTLQAGIKSEKSGGSIYYDETNKKGD